MNIKDNKGVALVITLLVLALLITLILEFNSGMRVEARAAANFRDDMKAYYLAKSGVTFAITLLEEDSRTEPKYDALNELWAQNVPLIPVGDGFVSVKITDENSKINVNKLPTGFGGLGGPKGNDMRAFMVRFLEQFELKGELSDAIADWVDKDDKERVPGGAESSYYEGLEESYEAKNMPMDSLQELRLIKGVDADIFGKLKDFLTVTSDGTINVNTVGKEVLTSLEDISEATADEIIAYRSENPFQKREDVKDNISITEDTYLNIVKFINVNSNFFSITSMGEVNKSRKVISAVVKRKGSKANIIYWRVE